MARAKGREGTERVVPRGVLSKRPSNVTPYHCSVDDDKVGEDIYCFMVLLVGFSSEMFVAELEPSTPAEIGLSTSCKSVESFMVSHGGETGETSTVLKKRLRPAMRVSRAKFLAFSWFFEEL